MWFMTTRLIALMSVPVLFPAGAQACSIIIQIKLDFPEYSVALDRAQIVRLANWLDEARGWYKYSGAEVEGSARTEAPDSDNIALQRMETTVNALKSLSSGLPIHFSSRAYPSLKHSRQDYAVIQLIPLNPPKCGAVPIPGFKY